MTDLAPDELYRDLVAPDPVAWSALPAASQREQIMVRARNRSPLLSSHDLVDLVERMQARVNGLGALEAFLHDESVTEVMVNGDGRCWIERRGRLVPTGVVMDEDSVLRVIERIVAPLGRRVDRSSPVVDARLPDGSRVNAIVRPVAVDGPCLTIRRFGARLLDLEAFTDTGTAAFLRWAVQQRANIIVSGGTGSGKTTLLNSLAGAIPPGERVITIEDTAELRLGSDHVVRLESRTANAEGTGELSVRDLVRNALRMRPDRIVVGEVRGDEVIDMLTAMNTGHEGSLSTMHANRPDDAIRRLEAMILMGAVAVPIEVVRQLLVASIDLVVQVSRAPGGSRRITEIHELSTELDAGRVRSVALTERTRLSRLPARAPRGPGATPPDTSWLARP